MEKSQMSISVLVFLTIELLTVEQTQNMLEWLYKVSYLAGKQQGIPQVVKGMAEEKDTGAI